MSWKARSRTLQEGLRNQLELPIFDWGGAKVAKAEAIYMQAVERAAEAAINARSEVRESLPRLSDPATTLPATTATRSFRSSKRISEENVLRYNGMLIGVFELLADARTQIATRQRLYRGAARFLDCRRRSADGDDRQTLCEYCGPHTRSRRRVGPTTERKGFDHDFSSRIFQEPGNGWRGRCCRFGQFRRAWRRCPNW